MSNASNSGGQSMDDILASIRRIISEDGDQGATPPARGNLDGVERARETVGPDRGGLAAGVDTAGSRRDDLSDISDILVPLQQEESAATIAALSQDTANPDSDLATWPFDAGGRQGAAAASSLQSKLASLGSTPKSAQAAIGRGIPAGLVEPDRARVLSSAGRTQRAEPLLEAAAAPLPDSIPEVGETVGAGRTEEAVVEPAPVAHSAVSEGIAIAASAVGRGALKDVGASVDKVPKGSRARMPAPADQSPGVAATQFTAGVAAGASQRSLEAVVVEALRPMLREWLDANLPRLVEQKLDAEIARLERERLSNVNR